MSPPYRQSAGRRRLARQVLLIVAALCVARQALAEPDDGYRLNAGDILEISVWKEEAMQREVVILPDGRISYPLAGHLMAAGMTVEALEGALARKLQTYYPNTVVSVAVKSAAGNKVYVIGEVGNPGAYQVARRTDIMQVLSLAGGLSEAAEMDGIIVLRRVDGRQNAIPFDYQRVRRGQDLSSNVLLQSGDVVVVPKKGLF